MISHQYGEQANIEPQRVEPINLHALQEACGTEGAHELLQIFLDSTAELFLRMNAANNGKDSKGLKAAAHEMKGACGSVGANKMAAISRSLESAALAEDWPLCGKLVDDLQSNFRTVKKYCEDILYTG
jgi:HPt (histidine-containing phosphotransfer) domain-containing protein